MAGNITRGLSSDRNYEVGMMTEGNIPGKKKIEKNPANIVFIAGVYQIFTRYEKGRVEGRKKVSLCNGFFFRWHKAILKTS